MKTLTLFEIYILVTIVTLILEWIFNVSDIIQIITLMSVIPAAYILCPQEED